MMLKGAKLQVPNLVDPCSRFSFVNYLKQIGRLFHFCTKEDIFITRHEYNQYCRWVAAQRPASLGTAWSAWNTPPTWACTP